MCNPHPVAEVPCFSLDQSDDDDDILEVGANASSPTDAAECQADPLDQTDTSAPVSSTELKHQRRRSGMLLCELKHQLQTLAKGADAFILALDTDMEKEVMLNLQITLSWS